MSIETFNLISTIGMIVVICFALIWFSIVAICIVIRTKEYKDYLRYMKNKKENE